MQFDCNLCASQVWVDGISSLVCLSENGLSLCAHVLLYANMTSSRHKLAYCQMLVCLAYVQVCSGLWLGLETLPCALHIFVVLCRVHHAYMLWLQSLRPDVFCSAQHRHQMSLIVS